MTDAQPLTRDDVAHVAKLARLALSDDELEMFTGQLASVLRHFLGLYAGVNTFTQLVLASRQRQGTWKTWPPLAGDAALL